MKKFTVYNLLGEKTGEIERPSYFSIEVDQSLIHRYFIWARSVMRDTIAHTKTRGDISGGGRKPWKQKGTGRARTGSTRNPIWRHGGTIFGPLKVQNFATRMPRFERRKALWSALSSKADLNQVIVLDTAPEARIKTKEAVQIVNALTLDKKKKLIWVIPEYQAEFAESFRNIPGLRISTISRLNITDLLSTDGLVMTKSTLEKMNDHFSIKI